MSISSITEPESKPTKVKGFTPEEEEQNRLDVKEPTVGYIKEETTEEVPSETEAEKVAAKPKSNASFLDTLLEKAAPVGKHKTPLKMLIYSLPGAGKTTLVGGIPNNFIIDTEAGRITLEENQDLVGEGVRVLPYKSFEALEQVIKTFHESPDELKGFKTVTIDTLNNLQKRATETVTEREWNKSPTLTNRYVPEVAHYTEVNELIRRLVQSMADLNRNIVFCAHSRTIEPKNQDARTFPDFSEKLANTIAGMVDVVGYMYMTEIEGVSTRVMKFRPSGTVTAKTRIKGLPDNMIDPTWDKIKAALS